jgi:hypothetical protein
VVDWNQNVSCADFALSADMIDTMQDAATTAAKCFFKAAPPS